MIMDDHYFINRKDNFLQSRDSFDSELTEFVKIIRNTGNLRYPLVIELPMLSKSARHQLHTYQRKGKVTLYSVGDNHLTNFKKMRICFDNSYLESIVSHLPQQIPEIAPVEEQLPQLPEENKNTKIVEYLNNIKELIDKIITEIR